MKPRINVQQNTTNSVLLKQFNIIFTYQAGRHVKTLITYSVTESVERQVLMYSAAVLIITVFSCITVCSCILLELIITPESSQHFHLYLFILEKHELKGAWTEYLIQHWF